ncbi:putative membrane protein (TIGR02226 family) [Pacificibacter maritimus]|uniref:Putative membrane protein (TIGR02226 family) n=1 Tax=Pacificibacter maritimus TaxID=762213 RepID=A0A3N4U9P2_9RHOB|nr:DUF4159 domain-containing protein [Pacificibacter maritimus]RPE67182.1 putative membrane protein (TIGR02226 family) [Pacificibacter maritimus]
MLIIGPIGFTTAWVLWALALLPVMWIVLRAVPPAPQRRRFAGVALLLGLDDSSVQAARTPWWLLMLRLAALAALIFAFSGPVWNPKAASLETEPLLIVVDGTWADAPQWSARVDQVSTALDDADRSGRLVSLITLTDLPAGDLQFLPARAWQSIIAAQTPAANTPNADAVIAVLQSLDRPTQTLWLSDGLAYAGRQDILAILQDNGPVRVVQNPQSIVALGPVQPSEAGAETIIHALNTDIPREVTMRAFGPDPNGIERILGSTKVTVQTGVTPVEIDLLAELRNRVTYFDIEAVRSAAAVQLAGDSLKRPKVALVSSESKENSSGLLSNLHYLRTAFQDEADVIEGAFSDSLLANPDVIVMADVARLAQSEAAKVLDWVTQGGLLLRFAGPRLAASDVGRDQVDPLMPVRLRIGGRSLGGAMSWGNPKQLRPFDETSPFYGLDIPDDVTVSSQVLAEPDPDLAQRVIATLADGTPLVTRKAVGQGQVVLFHVTANADWSTLPLSGLFLSMLERLSAAGKGPSRTAEEFINDLTGQSLSVVSTLDAFGTLSPVSVLPPVAGVDFARQQASKVTPAGLYLLRDQSYALNVFTDQSRLEPANWPSDVELIRQQETSERPLIAFFLVTAFGALLIDVIATLGLAGRLPRFLGLILVASLCSNVTAPQGAAAQDGVDALYLTASSDVTLAYVLTGDADTDFTSRQGLIGLSKVLRDRTSVEPADPVGVDLESDPLGVFPILYWPISDAQTPISAESYAKLNTYMRGGGMIFFDTRDGDIATGAQVTAQGTKLRSIARYLDVPPLDVVPQDHVITRSFYLLDNFPGRYANGQLWAQKTVDADDAPQGVPFRNLNDNVSPVMIGGNDWAAAWAITDDGRPLRPIGSGYGGERQREMAKRFGVNLILYVLTGSYKSDQVHVPALLERLGE